MRITRGRHLALTATLATVIGVGVGAIAPPATAGPADYNGFAYVDLVHADVNLPGTTIVDGAIAPALAEVNSAGLDGGKKSHAAATQIAGEILGTGGELLTSAEQDAPPDNPTAVENTLIPIPDALGPLLKGSVATAFAHARWVGAMGCLPAGQNITEAREHVAQAQIINDTPAGASLVSVENRQGTTVFTKTTNSLVDIAGSPNKGLKSEALTQLTAVTLFQGTSNEFTVNVVAPPVVTAIATGKPGGASVTYSEPILQIVQNGTVLGELNATSIDFELPSNPLISLRIGTLNKTEAANGTSAAGDAALLDVEVLPDPTVGSEPVVHLSIAHGFVAANVPVGGINCSGGGEGPNPLRETHKDATVATTTPGASFNYTIAVPNRGSCTLTAVKVEDTVTGPEGSTITDTAPDGNVDGLTVTWDDIGPIAANQTKTLTITVKVPDDASVGAKYTNHVKVTGTCDGTEYTKEADYSGPTVGPGGLPGCSLNFSNKAASHIQVTAGESFNYYVHVYNSGGSDCAATTVTDTLIPKVTFVSCSDGCTQNGAKLTWNLGTVPKNSGRTLVVTVKVGASAQSGDKLGNTAVISSGSSTKTVSTPGPTVSGTSVLAPPNPAVRGTEVQGEKTAITGIGTTMAMLGMLLAAGGALLRRRIRFDAA